MSKICLSFILSWGALSFAQTIGSDELPTAYNQQIFNELKINPPQNGDEWVSYGDDEDTFGVSIVRKDKNHNTVSASTGYLSKKRVSGGQCIEVAETYEYDGQGWTTKRNNKKYWCQSAGSSALSNTGSTQSTNPTGNSDVLKNRYQYQESNTPVNNNSSYSKPRDSDGLQTGRGGHNGGV